MLNVSKYFIVAMIAVVFGFTPVQADDFWTGVENTGNIEVNANFFSDDSDVFDNVSNANAFGAQGFITNNSTDSNNTFGQWTMNSGNVSATSDFESDDYEVEDNETNTTATGAMTVVGNTSTGVADMNEFFIDTINSGTITATTNFTSNEDEVERNYGLTRAIGASTSITSTTVAPSMPYYSSDPSDDEYGDDDEPTCDEYCNEEPSSNGNHMVNLGEGLGGMNYENNGYNNWFRSDTVNSGDVSAVLNITTGDGDIEDNGAEDDMPLTTLAIGAAANINNTNPTYGSYYSSSAYSTLVSNSGNISAESNLIADEYDDVKRNVINTIAIGASSSIINTVGMSVAP